MTGGSGIKAGNSVGKDNEDYNQNGEKSLPGSKSLLEDKPDEEEVEEENDEDKT